MAEYVIVYIDGGHFGMVSQNEVEGREKSSPNIFGLFVP